jgi:hypothetical protein
MFLDLTLFDLWKMAGMIGCLLAFEEGRCFSQTAHFHSESV